MFGDKIISSATGSHQGLLFSLNLQPVVEQVEEEVPNLDLNEWYLDDGTMVGSVEDLQKVVDVLQREGPVRGLFLSTSTTVSRGSRPKSTVWSPGDQGQAENPLARGIPRIQEGVIVLLGAPVGNQEFKKVVISRRVEKIRDTTAHLPLLQDPHTEFSLLRSCLSLPKFMFVLKAVDTTPYQLLLQDFDGITRDALNRVLAVPVTDLQWDQAKLPVTKGGLGLRAAEDHAPAAYATSYLSSQPLVEEILGRASSIRGGEGEGPAGHSADQSLGTSSSSLKPPLLTLL